MKTKRLADLEVSEIGLGCMGMSEFYGAFNDDDSLKVLQHAYDNGIRFFDTADMYGPYHNEELIAKFLKISGVRNHIKIATKFGIVRNQGEYKRGINNSEQYMHQCCDDSLKRIGVDYIDLFYVHRIDTNHPIEETMMSLEKLVQQGKVGHVGLCEVSATTLQKAHAIFPVTAVQTEYSLWTREAELEILPLCQNLGIGFVAYSPLGRGFLTGKVNNNSHFKKDDARSFLPRFIGDNLTQNLLLLEVIKKFAKQHNCSAAQIALQWVCSQADYIVPIPGTKRIAYLQENIDSLNVEISKDELAKLTLAISEVTVKGNRYTDEGMKGINA